MAWQAEVGTGISRATGYRDLLTKKVAMYTSRHVATVVVNAAGTGYVVGEVATLTHAGAFLDARFEVLTIGGGGSVTSLLIVSNGAFADRFATVAVNVGGTGYAVDDVVEVQGGTSREKGKAVVTTEAAGVVTGVAVFETAGAYSVAPGLTGAATLGIGPSGFAGDDALTLDLTMTGVVPLSANATTASAAGTGLTVDVTLAESGWTVDGRNTNSRDENSLDDEKEVVLVGDATGRTNKPIIGFITWTRTAGIDTRFGISCFGFAAHNPAIAFHLQPIVSPGINTGTGALLTTGSALLYDENEAQEVDFWLTVDDFRVGGAININSGAGATDNGQYMQFHAGLMDGYGTEVEQPYPMLVGASSGLLDINPSVASQSISGIAEQMAPAANNTGWFYYESEGSVWRAIINSQALAELPRDRVMFPMGFPRDEADAGDPDNIVVEGPVETFRDWSRLTRGAPVRSLLPVFSNTQTEHFLWPLNVLQKLDPPTVVDGPKGEVRGFFWVSATDDAAAQIANFSEDIVTHLGVRYRVFHNHVHTARYQYIAIKEDV